MLFSVGSLFVELLGSGGRSRGGWVVIDVVRFMGCFVDVVAFDLVGFIVCSFHSLLPRTPCSEFSFRIHK